MASKVNLHGFLCAVRRTVAEQEFWRSAWGLRICRLPLFRIRSQSAVWFARDVSWRGGVVAQSSG